MDDLDGGLNKAVHTLGIDLLDDDQIWFAMFEDMVDVAFHHLLRFAFVLVFMQADHFRIPESQLIGQGEAKRPTAGGDGQDVCSSFGHSVLKDR